MSSLQEFLVIPIHNGVHWLVAIVCFPGLVGMEDATTTGERTSFASTPCSKNEDGKRYHPEKGQGLKQCVAIEVNCFVSSLAGHAF